MPDRKVHAIIPGAAEVVRYDRAGKWWIEYFSAPRKQITLKEAVDYAAKGRVNLDLPGGARFDSLYRKVVSR